VANDTAKRLLARVKQLREAHGLTQEAFAEKSGLDYKYYQSVEAGRRRDLRLSTLEKLARACGLKLWELLNFDAEPAVFSSVEEDQADYGPSTRFAGPARKSANPKSGRRPGPKNR
jgi:transcriptional regulator with XRE-family HTH domain